MADLRQTEHVFGDLRVVATTETDDSGQLKITRLDISGDPVTSEALHRVSTNVIENAARWDTNQADLDDFKGRTPGEDPVAFAHRVAKAYKAAASRSHRPNILLAERAGVPVQTARSWVREARLRGLLEPGTRGKAG